MPIFEVLVSSALLHCTPIVLVVVVLKRLRFVQMSLRVS
jgi:hypothetical protein